MDTILSRSCLLASRPALLVLFGFFMNIPEVMSEFCDEEQTYCHPPAKCCETMRGCCYDNNMLHQKHFRMQVWNMWYFWFLIIFMMLSCFGGCGYLRRRRLALLSARSMASSPTSFTFTNSRGRRGQARQALQFDGNYLFAYGNGPGNMPGVYPMMPQYPQQQTGLAGLPPAYAEVMSQTGAYPLNKEITLPPYPGMDKPESDQLMAAEAVRDAADGASILPRGSATSLPPPYSEFPQENTEPPPASITETQAQSVDPESSDHDTALSQLLPQQNPPDCMQQPQQQQQQQASEGHACTRSSRLVSGTT